MNGGFNNTLFKGYVRFISVASITGLLFLFYFTFNTDVLLIPSKRLTASDKSRLLTSEKRNAPAIHKNFSENLEQYETSFESDYDAIDEIGGEHVTQVRRCDMQERLKTVEKACKRLTSNGNAWPNGGQALRRFVDHMRVVDKHKVLICSHAKVASSSVTDIIRLNANEGLPMQGHQIYRGTRTLNSDVYTDEGIRTRLETYFKVMVVRHPFDRLESLYNNKFVHDDGKFVQNKWLLRAHQRKLRKTVLLSNNGTTFPYIVGLMQKGYDQEHWDSPYYKACHPCQIDYDYIVKLETYDTDMDFVVNEKLGGLGLNAKLKANRIATIHELLGRGRNLTTFNLLETAQVDYLEDRLAPDLDMFGYEFERNGFVAKCRNFHSDIQKDCC